MTIDERLEKLTERHEALAQTVELFIHSVHELRERVDKILTVVESQTTNVEALLTMVRSH